MDLRTGESFWLTKPSSTELVSATHPGERRCDVLVVGAGVSGAMIADALAAEGKDVIVADHRDPASGSTAASTALLMYEIDTHLVDLVKRYGWDRASQCYLASVRSLEALGRLAQTIPCDFQWTRSLYVASRRSHVKTLREECEMRRRIGIDVTFCDAPQVLNHWNISAHGGLISAKAAHVDPVRLTRGLLDRAIKHGARLFSRTRVVSIQETGTACIAAVKDAAAIRANKIVLAAGYEMGELVPGVPGTLRSSYVMCSAPRSQPPPWKETCLVWESARPYVYLRTTVDGRLLIGGADIAFKSPTIRDRRLPSRVRLLRSRYAKMFPDEPEFVPELAWAGTFGESADGLPYIGPFASAPGCLLAMGFGGNGITWAMLSAELLCDRLCGRASPIESLFAFDRA